MAIEINFGNLYTKDNFDQNDFLNVKNSLINELGKVNFEKNNPNPQIIVELDWAKEINNIKNKNLIKSGQTILLNKPQDLYFIGDDNFIAITKYNRSHFYAKAVYDLSLEFK